MSKPDCGRELTGSRAVGIRRGHYGGWPRVTVMAFDPGPTR